MGVPSFFKWVYDKHERDIIVYDYPYGTIDFFYVDFNSGIHPAVKSRCGMNLTQMYQEVISYLENILDQVKPQKLIFIAIDGVAPRAKMDQQRKRRYKSVVDSVERNKIKDQFDVEYDDTHDFNMISPGTEFMKKLTKHIEDYITKKLTGIKVIFSDASKPGEGEHKIMDHIRANVKDEKIAIYGLDSDLIFLCLANYRENMVLFRETIHFGNKGIEKDSEHEFCYMLISELKDIIIWVMNPYTTVKELQGYFKKHNQLPYDEEVVSKINQIKFKFMEDKQFSEHLIIDYTYICFMLGNDFLSPIPSLIIREGGLDHLIQVYKNVQLRVRDFLVKWTKNTSGTSKLTINTKFLRELLKDLAETEANFMRSMTINRKKRVSTYGEGARFNNMSGYERAISDYEYIENQFPDKIEMGFSGWKERYYKECAQMTMENPYTYLKMIENSCQCYLDGMAWSLHYYLVGCLDWGWSYTATCTPCASDMLRYLDNLDPDRVLKKNYKPLKTKAVTPEVQLMCIMPPSSSQLLPKNLRRYMTDPDSPLIYMYPTGFKCSTVGKRFLWECYPKLPSIDLEVVENVVEKVVKKV